MYEWYGHPGGWGPGGWIWIAWMVLFWGGLLVAAIYLIRHRRPASALDATGSAETVLAERYARGEIDTEEYRRRQGVLREHRGGSGPGP
jgi:putative membrane protein